MSIYHKSFPSNILDLSPLKLICYLEVNQDPQVIWTGTKQQSNTNS